MNQGDKMGWLTFIFGVIVGHLFSTGVKEWLGIIRKCHKCNKYICICKGD